MMDKWKKNMVAAAVLVTVCAGIYVNWLYTTDAETTDLTDTLNAEKVMSEDLLVLTEDTDEQVFDIIDDLFQATGDGIAVTAGILAVEHIEDHHLVVIFQEVSLHHSQLIQVSHQSQISLAHVIVSSFEIIKSL